MSWTNRELHKEYRSYFFANHVFHIGGPSGTSYTDFLDRIGPVARASIRKLILDGPHFWTYKNLHFQMAELTSLRTLSIRMHIGHLVNFESYKVVHDYITKDDPRLSDFLEQPMVISDRGIGQLPALQKLEINCAVPRGEKESGEARQGRKKMEMHTSRAVLKTFGKLLGAKGTEVTVKFINGGAIRLKDPDTGYSY